MIKRSCGLEYTFGFIILFNLSFIFINYGFSYAETHTHSYQLVVTDVNGHPLKDATIDYNVLDDENRVIRTNSMTTGSDGRFFESVRVSDAGVSGYYWSGIDYEITRKEYFPTRGSVLIRDSPDRPSSENPLIKRVALIHPTDYLSLSFLS